MKKVFIGTVCSSAMVSAYYTTSIFNSQKLLKNNGIDSEFDIIIDEPLIQLARNKLLSIFLQSNSDELIFIDSDQAWVAEDLLKLVNSDKDFIGAPVVFKNGSGNYNVSFEDKEPLEIMEVDYVGTGFLKITRKVAQKIYDLSDKYETNNGINCMAFEVNLLDKNIVSEDFIFCKKWKQLGGRVFIDTSINPYHIGINIYKGNYQEYLKNNLLT